MSLADVFMWAVVGVFALCGIVIAWWFYDFERRVDENLASTRRVIESLRLGERE